MLAALYDRYGPPEVVRLGQVPTPEPAPGEVRIRVHATTVSSGDMRARSLDVPPGFRLASRFFFGLRRPRQPILGTELAGEVDAVGAGVTRFAPGDRVFAFPGAAMGCHAEFRCVREDGPVAALPVALDWKTGAALSFGGSTALHFLREARLQPGERLLVIGASGSVGSAAVQLGRSMGADVTGVAGSGNQDLVRSLGAQRVVDYTREDFTALGETWDVIMDTVGTAPYARCRAVLSRGARLLVVMGGLKDLVQAPWIGWTTPHRVVAGPAAERVEYLPELAELARRGEYRPVIDREYPLEDIVAAHRYVDTGRKRGNVVITVQ